MKLDSLVIHGLPAEENEHGGVNPSICLSSTFIQPGYGEFSDFVYSRSGNPTRQAVEKLAAKIEGAEHGFAFSTGMAATATVFNLLSAGDKVLLNNNIYGGTYRYICGIFENQGIEYELVEDFNTLDWDSLPDTVKAVFVETPSNPLLRVADLSQLANQAKKHGILTIADNTFMTSYLQRPLEAGIDIVVYSATKYLGGHSDILAGLALTNDDALAEKIRFLQKTLGNVLSPFDSYLLVRGIKTLAVRMDRHESNAAYILKVLKQHPAVENLNYPGSYSEAEFKIHSQQASGLGAVFSLRLNGEYDAAVFVNSLSFFRIAVSLGGVESLVCTPASMTHESFPEELRDSIGITDDLIRFSVGIENCKDLLEDIEQALVKAKR